MANEIGFGYRTGATLTGDSYQPSGTLRTHYVSIPEIGTTGYYTVSDAALVALDTVIVKEGGIVVMQGQYEPPVTSPTVSGDTTTIINNIATLQTTATNTETNVSTIMEDESSVNNVFNQTVPIVSGQTQDFTI